VRRYEQSASLPSNAFSTTAIALIRNYKVCCASTDGIVQISNGDTWSFCGTWRSLTDLFAVGCSSAFSRWLEIRVVMRFVSVPLRDRLSVFVGGGRHSGDVDHSLLFCSLSNADHSFVRCDSARHMAWRGRRVAACGAIIKQRRGVTCLRWPHSRPYERTPDIVPLTMPRRMTLFISLRTRRTDMFLGVVRRSVFDICLTPCTVRDPCLPSSLLCCGRRTVERAVGDKSATRAGVRKRHLILHDDGRLTRVVSAACGLLADSTLRLR